MSKEDIDYISGAWDALHLVYPTAGRDKILQLTNSLHQLWRLKKQISVMERERKEGPKEGSLLP